MVIMFGLPDITVASVGGVFLLSVIGLLLWGLRFQKVKV